MHANIRTMNKTVVQATKWSAITEVVSKLVMPISNMILARILVPEMFGIVASINMVISFCDVFTDAGFQKYVIQYDAENDAELDSITNVAFWANMVMSFLLWLIVSVFSVPISKLVACKGEHIAIIISCALLPIHALSSIPGARLRRDMDFRTLFFPRVISILVPFVVTLPIAMLTRSFWALIAGNIVGGLLAGLVMIYKVNWKPTLQFDFKKLKEMLAFSIWSVMEAVLVWIINWGDIFIIGRFLSQHYLGIYKTSIAMVNSIVAVVSASVSPVMLSALSRLQEDKEQYKLTFYNISFLSGLLLLPMGVGMFCFRHTMCNVALGAGWEDGATLMGIWGLISSIAILFNTYSGCVYVSMGKPKLSAIVQLCQIAFIIPAVYFSVQVGFECLSYTRALIRIVGMVIHSVVVYRFFGISEVITIKRLLPSVIASSGMAILAILMLGHNMGVIFELLGMLLCAVFYFLILLMFPSIRKILGRIKQSKSSLG